MPQIGRRRGQAYIDRTPSHVTTSVDKHPARRPHRRHVLRRAGTNWRGTCSASVAPRRTCWLGCLGCGGCIGQRALYFVEQVIQLPVHCPSLTATRPAGHRCLLSITHETAPWRTQWLALGKRAKAQRCPYKFNSPHGRCRAEQPGGVERRAALMIVDGS